MAMTKEEEWAASIQQGWDWHNQYMSAVANADMWYKQIKSGEVPSGNAYQQTKENPVEPTTDKPMGDA